MVSMRDVIDSARLGDRGAPFGLVETMGRLPPSGSVRKALHAFQDPQVDDWKVHKRQFKNLKWTRRCQGIATDGARWFVTSNSEFFPGVYRLSSSMDTVEQRIKIPRSEAGHVGDLDVYDERLYVALEEPAQIAIFDLDLNLVRPLGARSRTRDNQGHAIDGINGHFAWCAVDPWNDELLYTSGDNGFRRVERLVAFHRTKGLLTPTLRGKSTAIELEIGVERVQGACFSPNGKVYVASDGKDGKHGIYCFRVADGRLLGRIDFEIHQGVPRQEEAEGITFHPMNIFEERTYLHFVLLDKDDLAPPGTGDDVHFKSYAVPDPETA
jgi:hypothetical protein